MVVRIKLWAWINPLAVTYVGVPYSEMRLGLGDKPQSHKWGLQFMLTGDTEERTYAYEDKGERDRILNSILNANRVRA